MVHRIACILLFVLLGACVGPAEGSFAVRFTQFSAELDPAARATIQAAAAYAKANPLAPLSVDGYRMRPDPTEPDTLRQERVHVVTSALVDAGVDRWRIQVLGTGIVYPQGVPMPALPSREVIINAGL